jgi:hypothetical protein
MDKEELQRVVAFIEEHHVMSLATTFEDELSVCSLFYVFHRETLSFVVASSKDTTHVSHSMKNSSIAGNILLETKRVGEIKGLQFKGNFLSSPELRLKKEYYKQFPYALAMNPTLWQIKISSVKLTDNTLGFGKKIELYF